MRALSALFLLSCGDKGLDDSEGGDTTPSGLAWYTTCGDPVCSGYSGPYEGVPACTTEAEGAACASEGAQCDFQSDCDAVFVCASEDPKDQTGGCPISSLRHKRSVAYLTPAEVDGYAAEAVGLPLARWAYTTDPPGPPGEAARLGFLIEDVPGSPGVRPDGQRVDLYGYTSLAIAAVQQQDREIQALRAEIAALRAEVEAMRAAK